MPTRNIRKRERRNHPAATVTLPTAATAGNDLFFDAGQGYETQDLRKREVRRTVNSARTQSEGVVWFRATARSVSCA